VKKKVSVIPGLPQGLSSHISQPGAAASSD